MKPLTANLKHFYQIRRIWLLYLWAIPSITAFALGAAMKPDPSMRPVPLLMIFIMLWGLWIGSMVAGAWNKPFAFCLPGHSKAAQQMLLLGWLLASILGLLSMSRMFLMDGNNWHTVLTGLLGIITLCYFAGVAGQCSRRGWLKAIVWILYLSIIILNSYTSKGMAYAVKNHIWFIVFISVLVSWWIFHDVTGKENIRNLCGVPLPGLLDFLDPKKLNRLRKARMWINKERETKMGVESISGFFSGRIKAHRQSVILPHLWRETYLMIGQSIVAWKATLPFILIFPVAFSLSSIVGSQSFNISFMIILLILSTHVGRLGKNSRADIHFLLKSRRDCFLQGIIEMAMVLFIFEIFIGVAIILSHIWPVILPNLAPFGSSIKVAPIDWRWPAVVFIILPFYSGIKIIFQESPVIVMLGTMIIILFIALFSFIFFLDIIRENISFTVGIMVFLLITAMTWGFHMTVLYYDSMKRSLC